MDLLGFYNCSITYKRAVGQDGVWMERGRWLKQARRQAGCGAGCGGADQGRSVVDRAGSCVEVCDGVECCCDAASFLRQEVVG